MFQVGILFPIQVTQHMMLSLATNPQVVTNRIFQNASAVAEGKSLSNLQVIIMLSFIVLFFCSVIFTTKLSIKCRFSILLLTLSLLIKAGFLFRRLCLLLFSFLLLFFSLCSILFFLFLLLCFLCFILCFSFFLFCQLFFLL